MDFRDGVIEMLKGNVIRHMRSMNGCSSDFDYAKIENNELIVSEFPFDKYTKGIKDWIGGEILKLYLGSDKWEVYREQVCFDKLLENQKFYYGGSLVEFTKIKIQETKQFLAKGEKGKLYFVDNKEMVRPID